MRSSRVANPRTVRAVCPYFVRAKRRCSGYRKRASPLAAGVPAANQQAVFQAGAYVATKAGTKRPTAVCSVAVEAFRRVRWCSAVSACAGAAPNHANGTDRSKPRFTSWRCRSRRRKYVARGVGQKCANAAHGVAAVCRDNRWRPASM